MNTQLIDSLVTTATDIVLIVGLLSPLLVQALRFAKAHTANKRIQVLESYAERVVLAVEQQRNLLPSDKKKLAVKRFSALATRFWKKVVKVSKATKALIIILITSGLNKS